MIAPDTTLAAGANVDLLTGYNKVIAPMLNTSGGKVLTNVCLVIGVGVALGLVTGALLKWAKRESNFLVTTFIGGGKMWAWIAIAILCNGLSWGFPILLTIFDKIATALVTFFTNAIG